jgi:hypothetical protein
MSWKGRPQGQVHFSCNFSMHTSKGAKIYFEAFSRARNAGAPPQGYYTPPLVWDFPSGFQDHSDSPG